ncbi:hypothetical protein [Myxosarcina sp. GI1]|uniref:hypothetical protein n=1 Tax=Myxosarcina sp. GI1 TaxID=1541065 RepID=UPI00068CF274|nr:hypothetical protein [Myxosarcina sp. GI1]
MSVQNSITADIVRPDDLMAELDLKKSTYYDDLKFLGITASKDEDKKAYLTFEEAEQVRALRSHVNETGKSEGFQSGALVHSSNNELATNPEEDDIYIEPEEPTANFDLDGLVRGAAELKARELAMPHLVKREVANRLTEEELPEDLREKIQAVREVANPKFTPGELADRLLSQWRKPQGN